MHVRSATRWWDRFASWRNLTKTTTSVDSAGVHSEEVFRNLRDSESSRAERSGLLFRILLVYRTDARGMHLPMERDLAMKTAALLSANLRATDSVGWYRESDILGAVLTGFQPSSSVEWGTSLTTRLMEALRNVHIGAASHSIQIRLLDQDELASFNASDHPAPFSISNE